MVWRGGSQVIKTPALPGVSAWGDSGGGQRSARPGSAGPWGPRSTGQGPGPTPEAELPEPKATTVAR